jgi:hypothetical protein
MAVQQRHEALALDQDVPAQQVRGPIPVPRQEGGENGLVLGEGRLHAAGRPELEPPIRLEAHLVAGGRARRLMLTEQDVLPPKI